MSQNSPKFRTTMNNKNRPNVPSHGMIFTLKLFLFLLFLSISVNLHHVHAGEDPLASPKPDPGYNYNNARSNSSLMVMLVILFFGFCVIFCIAVCILKCSNNNVSPSEAHEAFAGTSTAKANNHGLEQSQIDLIPKFVYSDVKELKIGSRSLKCAICLSEFMDMETLRLLPKCNHVFHVECIDFWLVGHDTCPLCRANLILDLAESSNKDEDGDSRTSCDEPCVHVTIEDHEKKVKLPRPHSTGHLMIRPASDDIERFTLRLPNEVRQRLLASQPKRITNLVGVSSSLRGYRSEGSGSSRYDHLLGRVGKQCKSSLPL